MRSSRVQAIVVAATALVVGAWFFRVPAAYAWMRHTGSVAPHGMNTIKMMGKPGTVVSILGHSPQVGNQETLVPTVGAYHVLVLFSADSLSSLDWNVTANEITGGASQAWNIWTGEPGREHAVRREFRTRYDGLRRTAELGGRRYSLEDGNLFVVRYDARGGMSVRQLPHTFRDDDSFEAVRMFQSLLPGDPTVRDLLHYDYGTTKPCPRRQASPPRGAAA